MRYFPSAPWLQRAHATSVMVPLIVGVLAVPLATQAVAPIANSAEPDDLRDKRHDVRQQIRGAQQRVEESSKGATAAAAAYEAAQADLVAATADLVDIRTQLYAARALDGELQVQLAGAEARLDRAQEDAIVGQAAVDTQRALVKDLVVSLYQQGDPTLVALSGYLGAQTPSDLIRRSEYAESAATKQGDIFGDLTATEELLRMREDEVLEARDDVAESRSTAAAQLVSTQQLADQAQAAKAQVVDLVRSNKVRKQEAAAARRQDLNTLRQLKREDAKVKRQILAAVQAAAAAAAAAGDKGFQGQADGFLDLPVDGYVTSPFGYRVHPIYGYYSLHDGIDFGAPCGQPVRAVADGTVVSSYYSSVYGYRLFVNLGEVNGANLTVVYNHSASYQVSEGDKVSRGEIVGDVGSTGWSTGCHLHFTVLEDGEAVDPQRYL